MKNIILAIATLFFVYGPCQAQTVPPQGHLTITPVGGACDLDWEAVSGRTYFIQYSFDLEIWYYLPVIEYRANGGNIAYWFECDAEKVFVRLEYTDILPGSGGPYYSDYDGDGYTNIAEIEAGVSPLVFTYGPQNPGGGGVPELPDYPLPQAGAYKLNFDITEPEKPSRRIQLALDEHFNILTNNGAAVSLFGTLDKFPVGLPPGFQTEEGGSGTFSISVQLIREIAAIDEEIILPLYRDELSQPPPNYEDVIEFLAMPLTIPPNQLESNVAVIDNVLQGTDSSRSVFPVAFKTFDKEESRTRKAHFRNLETRQNENAEYGNYIKLAPHVWTSNFLDVTNYYMGGSAGLHALKCRVNGNVLTFNGNFTHELNFVGEPQDDEVTRLNVEVLLKETDEVLDQMIITVVPRSTKSRFDQWYLDEKDSMEWLAHLPSPYNSIVWGVQEIPIDGNGGGVEDVPYVIDPEGPCAVSNWQGFGSTDTYFHPDAFVAARSEVLPNEHGHQACYDENNQLITQGLSAGTADRVHALSTINFPNPWGAGTHNAVDVKPFIWAVHLDGNPVNTTLTGANFDFPLGYEGKHADQYLEVRPPLGPGAVLLNPGQCP